MKTHETEWLGIGAAIAALLVAMTCTAAPNFQQWPKQINTSDARIMVYEPQVETFGGGAMTARAAVSVQTPSDAEPVFGVAWFESQADTNRSAGTVDLFRTELTQVRFPQEAGDAGDLGEVLALAMSRWNVCMRLDDVLASVAEAEAERSFQDTLNNEPPTIVFSDRPAMLVVLDGEPKMAKIEGTGIMRLVNTPYIMVLDEATGTYYLKAGDCWMKSRDIYGTWDVASMVPSAAIAIAEGDGNTMARGMTSVLRPQDAGDIPTIIVATEPTELVVIDGKPQYVTITGTSLLYVSNTDNDLFLDIDTQKMYLLIAGRWFTARQPQGPWNFIQSDRLPATFAHIPPDSVMGHVLASVAGTDQAADAVAATYLPQTAAVRRSEASVTVIYDGSPRFEPIVGTTMLYAVNSPQYVVFTSGWYYACDNAVWFVASSPIGPWAVCDSVPRVIYTIPPSSPVYHVRYVRIYHSTPDVVYVGYLPGYTGSYIYRGCVVYGTGYRYRGWYSTVYYPRPVTWGFGFRYSSHGGWNIGIGINWGGCFGVTRVNYVYGGWWGCGGFRVPDRHHPRRDRVIVVDRRDHDRFDRQRGPDGHNRRMVNVYDRRRDVVARKDDGRRRETRDARPVLDSRTMSLAPGRNTTGRNRDADRRDTRDQGDRTARGSSDARQDRPDVRPGAGDRTRLDRSAPGVTGTRPAAEERNDSRSPAVHGSQRVQSRASRTVETAPSPTTPIVQSPQETGETRTSRTSTSSPRRQRAESRAATPETAAPTRTPQVVAQPQQEARQEAPSRPATSPTRRQSDQSRATTVETSAPQVVAQPRQEASEAAPSRPTTPSARRQSDQSRATETESAQDVKEQQQKAAPERHGSARSARR